jgi:hypothetical protein
MSNGTNGPNPPVVDLSNGWQVVKIFFVVVLFLSAEYGIHAFTVSLDWTKIMQPGEIMQVFMSTIYGMAYGSIIGVMRALQVLAIALAGPSLWNFIQPLLLVTATMFRAGREKVASFFRKKAPPTI